MKKAFTKLLLIGTIFLLLSIAISCSKTDEKALFQQKLDTIDASIQDGDSQKAIDRLRSLRKKARFPVQYLSIAKRELQLQTPVQALQSIQAGLKKYPDDATLKAALTHTLLQSDRIDDAAAAAEDLLDTSYSNIGTEALIRTDKLNNTYRTSVEFWKEGFRLTGEQVFLENAGLMLAHRGDIAAAAALRASIPKKEALRSPYFWSCLAYDTGNFAPVLEDLIYSLVYADMAGVPENNPKAFEYARRHILLAADASAGLGDIEQARDFWQTYLDRYPNISEDVFYNLAMTAPTEQEKIRILTDCLTQNPGYYPVVAQYVRACAAINEANAHKSSLTEYLQNRDFFSLEMEKSLFVSSAFTLSPEQALENAIATNKEDPLLLLENFRYRYARSKNYAQGNGEMWKLLEQYPHTSLIKAYARWYFASSADLNACFSIEKVGNRYEDAFYDGIRNAVQGLSTTALKALSEAEQDSRYTTSAVINQAYIYDARNEPDIAVKYFTRAVNMLSDTHLQSKMLYETARIYAERNGIPEAIEMINRSLTLDPENRRASVLLRKLNGTE